MTVKRYDFEGIPEGMGECNGAEPVENPDGEYVTYEDYKELNNKLSEALINYEALQERVTEAYKSY